MNNRNIEDQPASKVRKIEKKESVRVKWEPIEDFKRRMDGVATERMGVANRSVQVIGNVSDIVLKQLKFDNAKPDNFEMTTTIKKLNNGEENVVIFGGRSRCEIVWNENLSETCIIPEEDRTMIQKAADELLKSYSSQEKARKENKGVTGEAIHAGELIPKNLRNVKGIIIHEIDDFPFELKIGQPYKISYTHTVETTSEPLNMLKQCCAKKQKYATLSANVSVRISWLAPFHWGEQFKLFQTLVIKSLKDLNDFEPVKDIQNLSYDFIQATKNLSSIETIREEKPGIFYISHTEKSANEIFEKYGYCMRLQGIKAGISSKKTPDQPWMLGIIELTEMENECIVHRQAQFTLSNNLIKEKRLPFQHEFGIMKSSIFFRFLETYGHLMDSIVYGTWKRHNFEKDTKLKNKPEINSDAQFDFWITKIVPDIASFFIERGIFVYYDGDASVLSANLSSYAIDEEWQTTREINGQVVKTTLNKLSQQVVGNRLFTDVMCLTDVSIDSKVIREQNTTLIAIPIKPNETVSRTMHSDEIGLFAPSEQCMYLFFFVKTAMFSYYSNIPEEIVEVLKIQKTLQTKPKQQLL